MKKNAIFFHSAKIAWNVEIRAFLAFLTFFGLFLFEMSPLLNKFLCYTDDPTHYEIHYSRLKFIFLYPTRAGMLYLATPRFARDRLV